MAHGFFTIEQWRDKQWVTVCHINGDRSLTDAIRELERRDKAGFFRVVQMQRMIWAEKPDGKLRLRKWHASSPDALSRSAEAFDRDGGKWPESR
jgi:5-formyltetrahydrofolate cyclo-ligase